MSDEVDERVVAVSDALQAVVGKQLGVMVSLADGLAVLERLGRAGLVLVEDSAPACECDGATALQAGEIGTQIRININIDAPPDRIAQAVTNARTAITDILDTPTG